MMAEDFYELKRRIREAWKVRQSGGSLRQLAQKRGNPDELEVGEATIVRCIPRTGAPKFLRYVKDLYTFIWLEPHRPWGRGRRPTLGVRALRQILSKEGKGSSF